MGYFDLFVSCDTIFLMGKREIIRTIYLYLFSLVGLVLVVIGSVRIVDLGLKAYVFKNADQVLMYPEGPRPIGLEKSGAISAEKEKEISPEEEGKYKKEQEEYQKKELRSRRERDAAGAIAMILVGSPLFLYHWKLVQRKKDEEK